MTSAPKYPVYSRENPRPKKLPGRFRAATRDDGFAAPIEPSKSEQITAIAARVRQASIDLYLAFVVRGAERPAGHPDLWPRALDFSQRSANLLNALRGFPDVRRAATAHSRALNELFGWHRFLCELSLRRTEKARSYTRLDADDAMQEASFGILRALELWDPYRGIAFATYATHWVQEKMRRFANNNLPINIPTLALPKTSDAGKDGRRARARRYFELDAPIPNANEHDACGQTGLDLLIRYTGTPEDPSEQVDYQQARKRLFGLISTLPEKQMDVLVGLCFRGESFSEIAERVGCTRQHVHNRWIEARDTLILRMRAKAPDLARSL